MRVAPLVVALLVLLSHGVAAASGAPGVAGPVLIDANDVPGRFFVGGGFTHVKTTLEFNDLDFEFEQQAMALTVGKQLGSHWSVAVSLGLVLGGELELQGEREFDIDRGFMFNLSAIRLFTFGAGNNWFVAAEAGAGTAIAASAEERDDGTEFGSESVTGYDVRGGFRAGRRLFRIWRPFVAARGFFGAVNWTLDGDAETATDKFFFHLGGGLMVDIPLGFSLSAEYAFVGERRLAVSLSSRL